MNILDFIKNATVGLKTNRLRALLTTLGIIIGVGTLTSMISIIEGINRYMGKVFGSIGSNTVYIQKYKWNVQMGGGRSSREWREIARRRDLTPDDEYAISQLPSVEATASFRYIWTAREIEYNSKVFDIGNLSGITENYIDIGGYDIEYGRGITETDLQLKQQIVVIGRSIVENVFQPEGVKDPIGEEIRIGGNTFIVIGILKERGQLPGSNLDDIAFIPLTTAQKLFLRPGMGIFSAIESVSIIAKGKEGIKLERVMGDIEKLLRERRSLRFDEENDFALNTQQFLVDIWKKLTGSIFIAMIAIASLALIVGGIGIMNIMLVSVTERTREIGIRMAVGARRRDILLQFLLEAIFLTLVGGAIGAFLGFGIAKIVDRFTPLPSAIPLWSLVIALLFSSFIGIFFGIYPASKASKMEPVEALRHE